MHQSVDPHGTASPDAPAGNRQPGGQAPAKLARAGLVLFLFISAFFTWYGRNQRSGWILSSFPGDPSCEHVALLGYCGLRGEDPFFIENEPFVQQVAFFSGWTAPQVNLYFLRPYPAFVASWFAPALGTLGALLLVNWLAWAVCAWAAWRLSKKLFDDDLSALLAVVFVVGGIGMVAHIGDYSAHLPGFASYYVGVYLLYASGILFGPRPWRTHVALGLYLAVASLVYSTGLLLTGVYLLSAVRHNRWYHVGTAAALALTSRPLWGATLRLLGYRVAEGEVSELLRCLELWGALFQQPLAQSVPQVALWLSQYATFDSPLVVLLGLGSCLFLPRSRSVRWFGILVLAIPVLVVFVFSIDGLGRGYVIYGISIWVYCWLGRLFAVGLRGPAWLRTVAGVGFGLVVVTHFAWSSAHLWYWNGPVKMYHGGWDMGMPYLLHPRPRVLSMTGMEKTPVLFGGDASLREAGALVGYPEAAIPPRFLSWRSAVLAQAPLFGYLALLGLMVPRPTRQRLFGIVALVVFAAVSSGLSTLTFRTMPRFVPTLAAVALPPGAAMSFRAELSESFLEALRQDLRPGDELRIFLPDQDGPEVEVRVTAGPVSIPVRPTPTTSPGSPRGRAYVFRSPQAALAALRRAGRFTLEMTNRSGEPVLFPSWQRPGLPKRRFGIAPIGQPPGQADSPNPQARPPAVEIRVLRPDGSLKLAGF
jgi:hypothetical protein